MKKAIKTIIIIQLCLFAVYLIGTGISNGFNLLEGENFPEKMMSLGDLLASPISKVPFLEDLISSHPIMTWFIVIPIYNIIAFFVLYNTLFDENSDSGTAAKIIIGILFGLPLLYFLALKTTVALYYISSIIITFMEFPVLLVIVFMIMGLASLPIVIII